jgi:large subunit ribosomal protein L2
MTGTRSRRSTKTKPEKSLLRPLKKKAGRNFRGKITVRHRGGGHKRKYRIIDFQAGQARRAGPGGDHRVRSEPFGAHRAAGLCRRRKALHPGARGLKVATGDVGPDAEIRPGNALPLDRIPLGTTVHNIELKAGQGGQLARAAGTSAQVLAKEGDYVTLRCPRARCAWCGASAWPPSARWATRSMATSSWARPVVPLVGASPTPVARP